MTPLMEEALRKVSALSQEDQDEIASQIIETLEDEAAWTKTLEADPQKLQALAEEALREHARGETRPLDEIL